MYGDDNRGIVKVYDRLNQSVEQANEQHSHYLVQDQQDRTVVVTPADGQIVADNARDANLCTTATGASPNSTLGKPILVYRARRKG